MSSSGGYWPALGLERQYAQPHAFSFKLLNQRQQCRGSTPEPVERLNNDGIPRSNKLSPKFRPAGASRPDVYPTPSYRKQRQTRCSRATSHHRGPPSEIRERLRTKRRLSQIFLLQYASCGN